MNSIIEALINTLQIILFIFVIGYILGILSEILNTVLIKLFGIKTALILLNRVTFIGVIHHELSHAIFGFISGAKIKSVDLFRPKDNSLGSVKIVPRGNKIIQSFQLTLTAIAPVLTGMISLCIIIGLTTSNFQYLKLWQLVIIIYLFISILSHSNMSKADLKCAIKGLPMCTILIFIAEYITKFNLIKFIINQGENMYVMF